MKDFDKLLQEENVSLNIERQIKRKMNTMCLQELVKGSFGRKIAYTDVEMYYIDFKNNKSKGLSTKAVSGSTFITGVQEEVDPGNTGYLTNCATIPVDSRVGYRRGYFGIWVDLGKVKDYDGKITITIDYFDYSISKQLFGVI